jgi:hypothetical protein
MSIRQTKLYKEMTRYNACACAEGFCGGESASEEEVLAAWQYIWDTGLWRSLQGWYGRTVHDLIDEGIITP